MVTIDKEYYYLDLDSIFEYLNKKNENEKNIETEDIYDAKSNLIQTNIITRDDSDKNKNIKYDIIKTMLEFLYNTGVESDNGNIKYIQEMEDTSMGSKLIFNTLITQGFIKNKLG